MEKKEASGKAQEANVKIHPARVDLEALAAKYGTPFQLYDEELIRLNLRRLISVFGKQFPHFRQHFAVKALPNPAILKIMLQEGSGLDCSSMTEIWLANQVKCKGEHTSFTSNYTSRADLAAAARQQVILNLDDPSLLLELQAACEEQGLPFPELISFRLNPGLGRTDSETKSNVLGGPDAKFGVAEQDLLGAYKEAKRMGAKVQNPSIFSLWT